MDVASTGKKKKSQKRGKKQTWNKNLPNKIANWNGPEWGRVYVKKFNVWTSRKWVTECTAPFWERKLKPNLHSIRTKFLRKKFDIAEELEADLKTMLAVFEGNGYKIESNTFQLKISGMQQNGTIESDDVEMDHEQEAEYDQPAAHKQMMSQNKAVHFDQLQVSVQTDTAKTIQSGGSRLIRHNASRIIEANIPVVQPSLPTTDVNAVVKFSKKSVNIKKRTDNITSLTGITRSAENLTAISFIPRRRVPQVNMREYHFSWKSATEFWQMAQNYAADMFVRELKKETADREYQNFWRMCELSALNGRQETEEKQFAVSRRDASKIIWAPVEEYQLWADSKKRAEDWLLRIENRNEKVEDDFAQLIMPDIGLYPPIPSFALRVLANTSSCQMPVVTNNQQIVDINKTDLIENAAAIGRVLGRDLLPEDLGVKDGSTLLTEVRDIFHAADGFLQNHCFNPVAESLENNSKEAEPLASMETDDGTPDRAD